MKQFLTRVLPILFCVALLLSGLCTLPAAAYSSITVGYGKTSIGPDDISNFRGTIIVADGVTEIQEYTFRSCDAEAIILPDSLKTIGNYAFSGCKEMKELTIPKSVTHIGKYAFQRCNKLTKITIPESVTSIGDFAFAWCDNLTTVYYNASSCNSISENEVYSGWFGTESNLKKLVIGLHVKTIPQNAFSYCSKLETLTIPANVKTIETSAFESCTKLKVVTLEEGLERIEDRAFYGCKALTEITIPDSVTYIGFDAFADCDKDLKINIEDESLLEPALEPERLFDGDWEILLVIFIILFIVLVLAVIAMQIICLVGSIKLTRIYCRKRQTSSGGLTAVAVIVNLIGFGFWYLLIIAVLNHGEKGTVV